MTPTSIELFQARLIEAWKISTSPRSLTATGRPLNFASPALLAQIADALEALLGGEGFEVRKVSRLALVPQLLPRRLQRADQHGARASFRLAHEIDAPMHAVGAVHHAHRVDGGDGDVTVAAARPVGIALRAAGVDGFLRAGQDAIAAIVSCTSVCSTSA